MCVCVPNHLYHLSTARCMSLGSEGNALYPVLSGCCYSCCSSSTVACHLSMLVCSRNIHRSAVVFYLFHRRCDSTEKLKSKLDDLRSLLSDPVAFKNIFRFAYDFAKVSCRNLSASALVYLSFSHVWSLWCMTDGYLANSYLFSNLVI